MASKRGNPIHESPHRKALSQSEVHPVADNSNTSGGNPAKMRVPASKGKNLSQSVGNPVAKRCLNKTGAKGAS